VARIISNLDAESLPTTALRMQAYSALDVCLTFGVHQALQKELAKSEDARRVYRFERAMQGPALTMALRGIAVDENECKRQVAALEADEERLRRAIDRFAQAWGMPGCNPNSPTQVAALLYDACGEAAYHTHEGTVTTGEEKLLMLQARSPLIGTIAHTILQCRAIRKAQGFLKARRSPDGRLRSSFNVGATTSGRWSFSKDAFGDGLNFGNIPKSRRSMFIPSRPSRVMVNVDLKQAESNVVAHITGDEAYIAAHATGDVHTAVAMDLWGEGAPTDPAERRKWLRDEPFFLGKPRRHLAKSAQHGCLTTDHEVLTPTGWIQIAVAKMAGVEIFVDGVGFELPFGWYDTTAETSLIEFNGQGYSQCVTPDHTMLTPNGERPAEAVTFGMRLLRTASPFPGGCNDAWRARLAAALFADGYQAPSGLVSFHFRKQRKIDRLLALTEQLDRKVYQNADGTVRIDFPSFPVSKRPAGPWVLKWNHQTLCAYVDEHRYWDAHDADGKIHVSTTHAEHAEWLQTLCHLVGRGSQRNSRERDPSRKTIWRVSLNNRRWARVKSMQVLRHPSRETRILCPVTSTGAFLVRRNGHISVSGNTNYGLEPAHASRMLGCKLADAKALQARYFGKYAGVKARIDAMPARLKENHVMVSPMGRVHQYLGHPSDKHTVKGALADEPQGIVADILNVALYRIWQEMDGRDLWLLNQNYDSILFECERSQVDRVTGRVRELMRVQVPIGDRVLVLDSDIGVGENWKEASA